MCVCCIQVCVCARHETPTTPMKMWGLGILGRVVKSWLFSRSLLCWKQEFSSTSTFTSSSLSHFSSPTSFVCSSRACARAPYLINANHDSIGKYIVSLNVRLPNSKKIVTSARVCMCMAWCVLGGEIIGDRDKMLALHTNQTWALHVVAQVVVFHLGTRSLIYCQRSSLIVRHHTFGHVNTGGPLHDKYAVVSIFEN